MIEVVTCVTCGAQAPPTGDEGEIGWALRHSRATGHPDNYRVRPRAMIPVGQSELAAFRQCPLLHRWRWIEGWHYSMHDRANVSSSSETGTLWHAVLGALYRRKQEVEASGREFTLQLAVAAMADMIALLADMHDLEDELVDLLTWMANGYLERWGTDPDWEILGVEERLAVPLVDPDDPGAPPEFVLHFTADVRIRIRSIDRVAMVDNKTVASQGTWGQADVDLHDQLGIYVRGVSRLDPDRPPALGILNQARRDKLKRPMTLGERFSRPKSIRTAAELDEIERDALSDMRRMHSAENLRRPTSHPDPKQCAWKCDFKEAHIVLRRSGGDWDRAREIMQARGMGTDPTTDPARVSR